MTEEEAELWRRYRRGDEKALEELVVFHLRLVKYWVRRTNSERWANQADLMQDGIVGLIEAIRKFDPDRGNEFGTFARYLVREAIFDSL